MAATDSNQPRVCAERDAPDRARRLSLDEMLAEMKRLAKQVAVAWTSPKSGVELVDEQRR